MMHNAASGLLAMPPEGKLSKKKSPILSWRETKRRGNLKGLLRGVYPDRGKKWILST
jgi:hypothetical protein